MRKDPVHLVNLDDLPLATITRILDVAGEIEAGKAGHQQAMNGAVLCPLFLQESSRTYINSVTSFQRLGGTVLPLNLKNTRLGSSWSEPVQDFMALVSATCDLVIARVPEASMLASITEAAKIPVINAGNGSGNGSDHPMQALVDLYVINKTRETERPRILMVGGKHIRTTRSQMKLFHRVGFEMAFVAPESPVRNDDLPSDLTEGSVHYPDVRSAPLSEYDYIYHNGFDEDPNRKSTENYVIGRSVLEQAGFRGKVLHSLPRLNELSQDVDDTSYNRYFMQMEKAKYVFQSTFLYMKEQNDG